MKKEETAAGDNLDGTAAEKATKIVTSDLLESTTSDERTLVIRHDNPTKIYERQKLNVAGILDTPFRYLEKRVALINQLASHLIVNREDMTLTMVVHEEDFFMHDVSGQLELDPDFVRFKINSKESWEAFAFGDFVRMNRTFFESIDFSNTLVTKLKSFKANVNTEKERVLKQNGDFRSLFDQTVKHNLPERFTLNIPIFKGYPKETIEVEVHVRPDDLSMMLLSPDGKDKQQNLKDKAIDEQLAKIREIAPDLLITEE